MEPWLVQLEETLPAEKFGKFLKALMTTCRCKGKLLWWMEREWEKLVEIHPEFSGIDPVSVQPICDVHRQPLHEERLKIVYGYFDPVHIEQTATECPFGRTFAIGPDWGGAETETVALVCPTCRDIYNGKHNKPQGEPGGGG